MISQTAKLDSAGRIVIPAAYRKALDVKPGDRVVLRLEDGELRVFNQDRAIKRAQDIVRKYIPSWQKHGRLQFVCCAGSGWI